VPKGKGPVCTWPWRRVWIQADLALPIRTEYEGTPRLYTPMG